MWCFSICHFHFNCIIQPQLCVTLYVCIPYIQHQILSPSLIPLVLSPLMPTTWGDAFVVHDIGQVQPSWVNLFSASVTCNKSTLFFIKWLRDPGGWAEQRAELLSRRPAQPSTHISRHPFWEITGLTFAPINRHMHTYTHLSQTSHTLPCVLATSECDKFSAAEETRLRCSKAMCSKNNHKRRIRWIILRQKYSAICSWFVFFSLFLTVC